MRKDTRKKKTSQKCLRLKIALLLRLAICALSGKLVRGRETQLSASRIGFSCWIQTRDEKCTDFYCGSWKLLEGSMTPELANYIYSAELATFMQLHPTPQSICTSGLPVPTESTSPDQ